MAENALSEQVDRIEYKLDALSESVDQRFTEVDKQFLEVREHFVEQRKYVEFAYDTLDKRMTAGFSRLDQRIDELDKRMAAGFSNLDERFSRLERKFDQVIDSRSRPASATRRRARPSKRRR